MKILDESGFVVSQGNEDGFLVERFRAKLEGKSVGGVNDVLVEKSDVAAVADGGVDQCSAICIANKIHLTQRVRRW